MRLRFGFFILSLLLPIIPASPAVAAEPPQSIELNEVASGLSTPVDLRAPQGDDRLFIVELGGRILIQDNGSLLATPFLDIDDRVLSGGERGLLGLAFHPDYESNRKFYVYYTDLGGDVRISEFRANAADPDDGLENSETILLEVDQPASNHNGGGLAFGPSGYLYIALGDGGGGGDPFENGQDTTTLLGSLLRIDVDGSAGGNDYAIPPSNPFVAGGGEPEIYAYGLRNPWRMSVDQATGNIYLGDVGQDRREEINLLTETEDGAVNFGWDVMEGTLCFEPSSGCNTAGKEPPILEYDNPEEGVSVIGGYVYRGNAMPWLRGTYFYSDLATGRIESFRYEGGQVLDQRDWTDQVGAIDDAVFSFGEDGFGELYVLAGSSAYRVEPARTTECDFDGDGDDDLAIGIPGQRVSGRGNAGAALVLETTDDAPGVSGDTYWHQDQPSIVSVAYRNERWGSALACGDFDGDGYDDLAVGAPGDGPDGGPAAGAVNVLYGSATGVTSEDQYFHQNVAGVGDTRQPNDAFGAALSAGDFDGDGYDDLAIGAPGERIANQPDAGMIHILPGSASGLTTSGIRNWHQNTPGIQHVAEEGDRFGAAVQAGDFNGDGYEDLAVGVPGEKIRGKPDAGLVQVFFGSWNSGLTKAGDLVLHQGQDLVADDVRRDDAFGWSLAAGPIDADGFDDLVVGVPGDDPAGVIDAGLVHFFPGSAEGPTSSGDEVIHQDSSGIMGTAEVGDHFGWAVEIGDVDGDQFGDVAVGVPFEGIRGKAEAGAVAIIHGDAEGMSAIDDLFFQDADGVRAVGEAGDHFGYAVSLLDFESDGRLDLVVGVPHERIGGKADVGEVAVLFGRAPGIVPWGDLRFHQNTTGLKGVNQAGDEFGLSLGS